MPAMETIDIIIVAGVSFLLVVGGLFFGMFVARRTEAARVARLEEREERLLAMRAKFEHERFAVAASNGTGDVELDEDLFRGIKEEIEQERMELDMRREELELDLKMLEEENERLKSRMSGRSPAPTVSDDASDEAVIVDETDADVDAIDALGDIGAAQSPPAPSDHGQDVEDAVFEEADADEVIARNTIFGDFYFERDGDGLSFDADSPDEADDEPDEEAEPVAPESAAQDEDAEDALPAAQDDADEEALPAEQDYT
ncbi:MAG: hypothetical protein HKN17_08430, partial [Rhodothermales bacterium]|nr:hypothetical protein [Rhodothermales bacterium]